MVKSSDVVLILIAILFPPAAAAFITGCSCDLIINICLTILGYIPGHVHALWLIYKKIKAEEMYGNGGYKYLGNGEFEPMYVTQVQGGAPPHQPVNYGATNA